MFHGIKRVTLGLWLAVSASAQSADTKGITAEITDDKVVSSIQVVRLSDGKTLYQHNQDKLLVPASVTKLITSAAALVKFGPAHQFQTKVFAAGPIKNGVINGDLVVVGDGDPLLVSEKLWQMAADLRHLGIKEVRGNLVVDNTLFGDSARDDSRQSGAKRSSNAYDAPVSAFGVNFNTFAVAVAPADTVGGKGRVGIDPYDLDGLVVVNNTVTTKGRATKRLTVSRTGGTGSKPEVVTAKGGVASGGGLSKIYRSVGNHVLAAGRYVEAFLKSEGIRIRGKIVDGSLPKGATEILSVPSYKVRRIVQGLNTFSNNYIADVLLKRLGATNKPGSGTFDNGLEVLRNFLRVDVGIKSDFTILNGSGLSEDNRFSAAQFIQLLRYMETNMSVFPEFLASLPAVGWDGTLRKRFKGVEMKDLQGVFRAKTGTLSQPISVSGLGGYFRHPQHGMVAFAILQNGKLGKKQPSILALREQQDRVLVEFLKKL